MSKKGQMEQKIFEKTNKKMFPNKRSSKCLDKNALNYLIENVSMNVKLNIIQSLLTIKAL